MASRSPVRRRHSAELKSRILAACAQPGASVAAVAQAHDLNPNVVHRWRRIATTQRTNDFVSLPFNATSAGEIRIELISAGKSVTVIWPLSATAHCTAWLRELLP